MENWINENYIDDYLKGNLFKNYCEPYPFKHAVLENFFSLEGLNELEQTCRQATLETSHKKGLAKDADWLWGPFCNIKFLKFYYGPKFRHFLNSLLDEELMPKTSQIPQINVFMPNSKGIPIHNDLNEDIGMSSIIQLTPHNITGGELVFYTRGGNGNFLACKKIRPIKNTLILFKIGENSYHAISDMSGDCQRITISIDWYLKEMLATQLHKNNTNITTNA